MKKIILIALCMMCIVSTASAYQLYLSCPESVQVGLPLKCSIDSNFPAGTTFDVVVYQSAYTATTLRRESVTIQENHNTQYKIFDTIGLPGGQYKVEIQFVGNDEGRLSSDSKILQLPKLIDRSNEITITSPMTQAMDEALRIEGSLAKGGNEGIEIDVRGPEGRVFGPQWIGTTNDIRTSAGVFTKQVMVNGPGKYEVYFRDAKGFVGVKTFTIAAPAPTQVQTPVATTKPVTTTQTLTTVPTPWPTATQSPLSPLPVAGALALGGFLVIALKKRQ